ncbi:putative membrane protein [Roseateles sp. YR242]|uniref:DUF4142 domain-containing protein n=1 Tax=Roseateles sp. YR242 TaxID=1855305 RepID=UPI0008B39289|nr:DUF4142 domain-containing protein [Roseateles sp. YR242]SEL06203.1 putative membrane protein [Roseateles sp. YR242]
MNDVLRPRPCSPTPFARWGRVAIAAAAIGLIAGVQAPPASAQAVVPGASAAPASKVTHKDAAFLKQAAENGHAEVEGSKLALQKSSNADVKTFAQQMVDDHTKAGDELAALAASKGVEVSKDPSVLQKGKLKMLGARDGASFDRHYAESVGVAAHKDTIKLFEKAAKESDDADVKAFAAKTLPTLQHHLQTAQTLETATRAADGKKPKK